jgi:hypothetical protein
MNHRRRLSTIAAVAATALLFAACGSDDAATDSPPPTGGDSLPPVSVVDDGYTHPTGAGDAVLDYSEVGGFVPVSVAFLDLPSVLVTGDGRVITQGPVIEIYPGPLLPNLLQRSISETGIQLLLAAADDAGLFADVRYEDNTLIADASTAVVTINANGQTFTHEAYALGFDGGPVDGADAGESPERQALADFVASLTDLESLVGAENLGPEQPYQAATYRIQAVPVDDIGAFGGDGIEPTVVEWPEAISVDLADAGQCAEVAVTEVGDLFDNANQLTFFDDGGVVYQVTATLVLPTGGC